MKGCSTDENSLFKGSQTADDRTQARPDPPDQLEGSRQLRCCHRLWDRRRRTVRTVFVFRMKGESDAEDDSN